MRHDASYVKTGFKELLESYDFAIDTEPFIRVTVHEFFWGYPSVLTSLDRAEKHNCVGDFSQDNSIDSDSLNSEDSWENFDSFDDWGNLH